MMTALAWFLDHWDGIAGILGSLHMLALAIVNLTDTPPPGTPFHDHFYRHVEYAAGIVSDKVKQTGDPDETH